MRSARGPLLALLTSTVFLCAWTTPVALANEPGGIAAPASPQAGGSQFGVPASVARPVVSQMTVPTTALPGSPPRITLTITEKGVGTVYLRARIIDLGSHQTVASTTVGWVHTSRLLTVSWPSSARLVPGSYRVTVSAHDHRNGNLLRGAHSSGASTLSVRAPAKVLTPTPSPIQPPTEAGVPTPAQSAAQRAVFPVQGPHNYGGPENRFGAPRSGHTHQGQDILTEEGNPDVAPYAGSITQASNQPGGAGYYVVEHTTVGFDFFFAHCEAGSSTVSEGQSVAAGQQLCKAGQTGDATAPHLHFEVWVGGWRTPTGHPIDPLPYLEAWEHDGAS